MEAHRGEEMSDYGYCITWEYIVYQMRKRYKIAPTNKTPRSMGEIERMINEIWYEYPGYDAAQKARNRRAYEVTE